MTKVQISGKRTPHILGRLQSWFTLLTQWHKIFNISRSYLCGLKFSKVLYNDIWKALQHESYV